MKPRLTLIAAMDEHRLIANSRGIPWRLPRDVRHFRGYTRGKWLLAGRRTFEEMKGWFSEGPAPLLLTSSDDDEPAAARKIHSVSEALKLAVEAGVDELVCIGGGKTFAAALPEAGRLVITTVHHVFPPDGGAAYFPEFDRSAWTLQSRERSEPDAEHRWEFEIEVWDRCP